MLFPGRGCIDAEEIKNKMIRAGYDSAAAGTYSNLKFAFDGCIKFISSIIPDMATPNGQKLIEVVDWINNMFPLFFEIPGIANLERIDPYALQRKLMPDMSLICFGDVSPEKAYDMFRNTLSEFCSNEIDIDWYSK